MFSPPGQSHAADVRERVQPLSVDDVILLGGCGDVSFLLRNNDADVYVGGGELANDVTSCLSNVPPPREDRTFDG